MTDKNNSGLSYIEVIIATAMFVVVLGVVFATISQATRNMHTAETHAAAHRHATGIMLAVRDAANARAEADASNPAPLITAADATAARFDVEHFTVWIDGVFLTGENWGHSHPSGYFPNGIITVAVWCDNERIIGRAVGMK